MREESLELVRSSRPQQCCRCGSAIPAREQAIKHSVHQKTSKFEMKKTEYWCMACEKNGT